MFTKKLFSILVAGMLLLGLSSNAYAELFSVSLGIPVSQSFSNEWSSGDSVESDGITGSMVHVKFPIMIGLGYEAYESKIKSPDENLIENLKLTTTMVDVFWLTPIPIVNVTVGAGLGQSTLDCDTSGGGSCSDNYDTGTFGTTRQLYGQLGFPFFPFLDVHASYHYVTAEIEGKGSTSNEKFVSNIWALGVAFIF